MKLFVLGTVGAHYSQMVWAKSRWMGMPVGYPRYPLTSLCDRASASDEVRQDLEGLQTMRTLARNMAWLLKCIEAAKSTVPYPEVEVQQRTNFVR